MKTTTPTNNPITTPTTPTTPTNVPIPHPPFTIPKETDRNNHPENVYPIFNALKNPTTHDAAMDALFTFLHELYVRNHYNIHATYDDMGSILMSYLDANENISNEAFERDASPQFVMGLSLEECCLLFGPPETDDYSY